MPTYGTFNGEHVAVSFNDDFFDAILRSPPVEGLVKEKAEQMLAEAKRIAPEDTGEYKQSLHIETVEHEHRKTYLVVSDDEDALLHESNFHTLTKALKKVRGG